jgi:hypothetical protein
MNGTFTITPQTVGRGVLTAPGAQFGGHRRRAGDSPPYHFRTGDDL